MPSKTSIGRPPGIFFRLDHDGRHSADQNGLGDSLGAVTADVARDLAASGGVTRPYRLLQVQRLEKSCQVIGVCVHLIAVPGLS